MRSRVFLSLVASALVRDRPKFNKEVLNTACVGFFFLFLAVAVCDSSSDRRINAARPRNRVLWQFVRLSGCPFEDKTVPIFGYN